LIIGRKEYSDNLLSKILQDKTNKILHTLSIKNKYKANIVENDISEETIKKYMNSNHEHCSLIFEDSLINYSSESFCKLLLNNNEYCSDIIISEQYPLGIPPKIRANLDLIFIFKNTNEDNIHKLYSLYGGIISSKELFKNTLLKYNCIVINNINNKVYYL
jgi:hypothetical protein